MDDTTQRFKAEYSDGDINCDTLTQRDQRSLIFHLLYAADAFDYNATLESIADNFSRGFGIIIPHESLVFKQTEGVIQARLELDELFKPLLDNWRFERLGVCTRLILRLGAWEILNTKTDSIIVINEAIELAKCFAEKDSYKFINGILDELVKRKERSST